MSEISGSLVCDADILASLFRISSPLSCSSTRSPESSFQNPTVQPTPSEDAEDRSELAKNNENLHKDDNGQKSSSRLANSRASSVRNGQQLSDLARLEESVLTSDSDRFADANKNVFLREEAHLQVMTASWQ